MLRAIFLSVGVIVYAFVANAQAAQAQGLPQRFLGVWQVIENQTTPCRKSDWDSNPDDTHVHVSAREFNTGESYCRISSVRKGKNDSDYSAVRLKLSCSGEGESWEVTGIWQVTELSGQKILLAAASSRYGAHITTYRWCP